MRSPGSLLPSTPIPLGTSRLMVLGSQSSKAYLDEFIFSQGLARRHERLTLRAWKGRRSWIGRQTAMLCLLPVQRGAASSCCTWTDRATATFFGSREVAWGYLPYPRRTADTSPSAAGA